MFSAAYAGSQDTTFIVILSVWDFEFSKVWEYSNISKHAWLSWQQTVHATLLDCIIVLTDAEFPNSIEV